MEAKPNSLGKAIYTTQDNAKLDEAVKNLLSQKSILAYILKYAVREFSPYTLEEIIPMIDQIHVATIAVEPGETNDMITGETQESKVKGEGTVTYDIRFIATLPGGGNPAEYNLVINVEAQAKQNLSYWVDTRAIAYGSRMISDQIGRNVKNSHYENLQKVYSIWVCMNCAQKDANTISEYGIREVNHVGNYTGNPRIDLISAIIIRLPKDDEWDKAKSPATNLTEMLSTLLSNKISPENKIETLEQKFGIEATEEIRQEVNNMCNYSSAVATEAFDKGQSDGQIRGAIGAYKDMNLSDSEIKEKLMQKFHLTEKEADEYLEPVSA